ncbi:hypothetical protein [Pandoraea pulmonicola]|uniref:Uncharacterized protein n=1 Tax=Pandoraea pulmonicola TaxID=93221 RepID=A0ABM5RXH7_PANPU|nr:hypothetical protein [Pandoraea pulmonicola]AJC20174.1 hypothetical protein RO07_06355 [Pandoraea pulmonicola]
MGITDAVLRQWAGIEAAGGIEGLARRFHVSLAAIRHYLRADGRLTRYGENRLNARRNARVDDVMLRQWVDLGRAGIEAAGGLEGLARRFHVSLAAIRHYLRADGRPTRYGEDRLNARRNANVPN